MVSFGLPDDALRKLDLIEKMNLTSLGVCVFELLEFAPLVMKKSTSILVELQSFGGSTIQVGHAPKFRRHSTFFFSRLFRTQEF